MSEMCHRGYKCMCFQCGEKDCEKYQAAPPKWIEEMVKDDKLTEMIRQALKGQTDEKHIKQNAGAETS